jgi:hypothetical protein
MKERREAGQLVFAEVLPHSFARLKIFSFTCNTVTLMISTGEFLLRRAVEGVDAYENILMASNTPFYIGNIL